MIAYRSLMSGYRALPHETTYRLPDGRVARYCGRCGGLFVGSHHLDEPEEDAFGGGPGSGVALDQDHPPTSADYHEG